MKTKRIFRFLTLVVAVLSFFMFSSCGGCGASSYATNFESEKANNQTSAENKISWIVAKLDESIKVEQNTITNWEAEIAENEKNIASNLITIDLNKTSIDEKNALILTLTDQAQIDQIKLEIKALSDENTNLETVNSALESSNIDLNQKIADAKSGLLGKYKENAKEIITDYIIPQGIAGEKDIEKAEKNYKVILINADVEKYYSFIDNTTSCDIEQMYDYAKIIEKEKTTCLSCFFSQTNVEALQRIKEVENGEETNLYDVLAVFTLQVTERTKEAEPLHFYADSFGDFMGHFFNNLFVFPVGWLLFAISSLFGNLYIVGLIITTLLIRTIGWPIYAKTNDMSIKMKAIEPEVAKIQEKYKNRKDPDSEKRMQMEQAQLYKKHGIGIGGCLLPFLQFPIFMAVYRAISRIPYTVNTEGTIYNLNWAERLNPNVFNLNLFEDYTAGTGQLIWVIILVLLVAGTQFISQLLSELRQKRAKDKAQEDVPMYRRQAVKQQANEAQGSMKMMMYIMIFMMAVFVWTSKAGLGVYWLIGNLYSMLQTYINSKQSEKKLEELRKKQKSY